jgi:ElaB/YqjD/DUF883 family membrane-anchored ribosome-binding protein
MLAGWRKFRCALRHAQAFDLAKYYSTWNLLPELSFSDSIVLASEIFLMRKRTASGIEALKSDVARLTEQLATVVDTTKDEAIDEVRAQMQRVKRTIDGLLSEAGDRGQEAVEAVRDVAEDFSETLEDSMHRRPLTTLALAVGLGFLCGVAWRR